ncbi:hypothetical protein H5410_022191 [Solanum commersonii]|uniref:Uncharacterized protein n=1 Tax=Solanum commersonii TaxID=4109 RepID=A0A9J5ZIX8_SOLCO|nr:hypothetical protein H5410_022191 [Solanum commersonii]
MLIYISTELSYVGTYHICVRATKWSSVVTEDSFVAHEDDSFVTTKEASSMTTSQSFIGVASTSNIKCSFCLCEECE